MNQQQSTDDENREIVERYLQGPDKAQAPDWEKPTFDLAAVTDRYGFVHNQALPSKLSKYESNARKIEVSRLKKWINMLNKWKNYYPYSEKLRARVYKGIPERIRGKVWLLLMDVAEIKMQKEGVYQQMLGYGLQYSRDIRQIDLDVNRTFRNHEFFRGRFGIKQAELFKLLVAYSVYNTEIGYTQGMSQIAALLLMYISDEEDAFWSLDRLMSSDKYAMHGFFVDGFPKFNRFATHHDSVLRKLMPPLYKHFKKYDIYSTLYTLKWFFQCFIERVPFSLTLRIWDCFMLDGEMILTCMSYTLLKLHKRKLLKMEMEELIQFLQNDLENDFGYYDDQVIEALQASIQELKRKKMESPRSTEADNERPRVPFGKHLHQDDISMMTVDDRSIAGSIVFRPNDLSSLAATSTTGSFLSLADASKPSSSFDETHSIVEDFSDRRDLIADNESCTPLGENYTHISPELAILQPVIESMKERKIEKIDSSPVNCGSGQQRLVPLSNESQQQNKALHNEFKAVRSGEKLDFFDPDDLIGSIRCETALEESSLGETNTLIEWPDKATNKGPPEFLFNLAKTDSNLEPLSGIGRLTNHHETCDSSSIDKGRVNGNSQIVKPIKEQSSEMSNVEFDYYSTHHSSKNITRKTSIPKFKSVKVFETPVLATSSTFLVSKKLQQQRKESQITTEKPSSNIASSVKVTALESHYSATSNSSKIPVLSSRQKFITKSKIGQNNESTSIFNRDRRTGIKKSTNL